VQVLLQNWDPILDFVTVQQEIRLRQQALVLQSLSPEVRQVFLVVNQLLQMQIRQDLLLEVFFQIMVVLQEVLMMLEDLMAPVRQDLLLVVLPQKVLVPHVEILLVRQ